MNENDNSDDEVDSDQGLEFESDRSWSDQMPSLGPRREPPEQKRGNDTTRSFKDKSNWPTIPGYDIQKFVGEGSFGVVFLAESEKLGGPVALKVLTPERVGDKRAEYLFRREIETAANITGPHVLEVKDEGIVPESSPCAGSPYLITAYMKGGDLLNWLNSHPRTLAGSSDATDRRERAANLRESIRIMAQVCLGLDSIHRAGFVHRDVKPDNVLLDGDGNARIADLGLAGIDPELPKEQREKLAPRSSHPAMSVADKQPGTQGYIAPEVMDGTQLPNARSDQWSAGAILYQLLSRSLPYKQATKLPDENRLDKDVTDRPPRETPRRPSSHDRAVKDGELDYICIRMVQSDPALRYPSMGAAAADMQRWLDGEPIIRGGPFFRLSRRARQTIRQRPYQFGGSLITIILLAMLAYRSCQYFVYERSYIRYFDDVVERWGVFEGLNSIGDPERRRASQCYRVQTKGWYGPVIEVARVNSTGALVLKPNTRRGLWGTDLDISNNKDGHEEARYDYRYDAAGGLMRCRAYSPTGKLCWTRRNISPTLCVFETDPIVPSSQLNQHAPQEIHHGSTATHVRYTFTKAGYKEAANFQDRKNIPQPNSDSIWGYRQRFDAHGQPVQVLFLGSNEKTRRSRWGVAGWMFQTQQRELRKIWIDENENSTESDSGIVVVADVMDDFGNQLSRSFFDISNTPITDESGVHRYCRKYAADGSLLELSFLTNDQSASFNTDGVSTIRYVVDKSLRNISEKYFDANGTTPVESAYGDHEKKRKYNRENQIVRETYYDANGKAVCGKDGVESVEITYFPSGQEKSQRYFGPSGERVITREGIHGFDNTIDQYGQLTEQRYIGPDHSLAFCAELFAIKKRFFDDRGRQTGERYFGLSKEPVTVANGTHGWQASYDSSGRLSWKIFVGIDEDVTTNTEGVSVEEFIYDGFSREGRSAYYLIEQADLAELIDKHCDIDVEKLRTVAQPILNSFGFHARQLVYDNFGRTKSVTYLDTLDREIRCLTNFSRIASDRDRMGNEIRQTYFGPNDELVYDSKTHVHSIEFVYDQWGRVTCKTNLDITGAKTKDKGVRFRFADRPNS